MDPQVVFVRDRERVTIPASVREEYGEALLDQVGHALKQRGITLKEVLEDGEERWEEVFRERYAELAKKCDLGYEDVA